MSGRGCSEVVMIVEDDHDVREAIVDVLEGNDYRALAFSNGQDAMAQLRAGMSKPCMILLDIMMPVMDGWEFRTVQQQDPELRSIPVVVLTAHANLDEAAARMGAATYLKKPIPLEALLSTVGRWCRPASI